MAAVHPGSGYGVLAGVPDDRRHGRRGHRGSGRLCGWPDRRRGCRSVRGGRLRHRRCRVSGRRASSDARPEFGLEADSSAPVLRLPAGGCTAGVPSSLAAGVVLGALIVTVAPLSGAGFSPVRGLAPDILASTYPALWTYFAGPAAGSAVAAAAILSWTDGKSPQSCAHHVSYARLPS